MTEFDAYRQLQLESVSNLTGSNPLSISSLISAVTVRNCL